MLKLFFFSISFKHRYLVLRTVGIDTLSHHVQALSQISSFPANIAVVRFVSLFACASPVYTGADNVGLPLEYKLIVPH